VGQTIERTGHRSHHHASSPAGIKDASLFCG